MKSYLRTFLLAASLFVCHVNAQDNAQEHAEGFLCCNMRTDGSWISDINYATEGMKIIPVGTPVKVTDYGRYRAYVEIGGGKQGLGNDYSRDLTMDTFVARYVLKADPRLQIATFPLRIQAAIAAARLTPGMTREQVMMSVGIPVSSENADLKAKIWRYWLNSDDEFQVVFDDAGRLAEISAEPSTLNVVVLP